MTVDFAIKKVPSYRVASIVRVGPWKEGILRPEFRELMAWAKKHHLRTGKWIFQSPKDDRWEACLEIRGAARSEGRIQVKTLKAGHAAYAIFDPDEIADRIIYHGLNDWLRWRRKDGEITAVRGHREVYSGDPWTDPTAWAHCEVQFLVRK